MSDIPVITWVMLFSGVLLNAAAQLLLKAGTNRLGGGSIGDLIRDSGAGSTVAKVLTQPFILAGLFCYVISVGLWIIVLSQVPVSVAYPMLSVGYVVNAVAAYFLFDERLSWIQIAGVGVIILGVFMLMRPPVGES